MIPSNLGQKYARNTLKKFYEKSVAAEICNTDYEGEIKGGGGDRVKILQFLNNVTLTNYSAGLTMAIEGWYGDEFSDLLIDQKKYYNFRIDDVESFEASVNDLDSNLIQNASDVLAETIDTYVLGLYTETKVGNRVGSEFTSSEAVIAGATVTTGTGAVDLAVSAVQFGLRSMGLPTGDAEQNTGDAWVGIGISFDSGTTWYKISSFTDSDTFEVTDWNDSTYTGGTKTGLAFTVEALYPKLVSASTIYADIVELGTKLNKNKIPKTDRYLVVPADIGGIIRQATELIPAVAVAYEQVVLNGHIGTISGFKVYENEQVSGNASTGWRCIAGHKAFITLAHAFSKSRVLDSQLTFGTLYQGLNVYGAKVTIERRKAGAMAHWILSGLGDDWTS